MAISFNSPQFIFFLLIFCGFYSFFQKKEIFKHIALIVAGSIFYFSTGKENFILLISDLFLTFYLVYLMEKSLKYKKPIFIFLLCKKIFVLCAYRYIQNFQAASAFPVGLSFYTFVSIAYVTDVYFGKISALKFKNFFSSSLFFPVMAAGPITKLQKIDSDLKNDQKLENYYEAIVLISSGLFKKAIAEFCNTLIYGNEIFEQSNSLLFTWVKALAFMAKYYADFSGYSDIAIGISKLMNVHIPLNFNLPFLSTSISDFWRRWHTSFSTFINEYLFQPLCYSDFFLYIQKIPALGKQLFKNRIYLAILVTLALSGLWHGFTLNFLFWGIYMGLWICLDSTNLGEWLKKQSVIIKWTITFLAVLHGFVIFMNSNLQNTITMFKKMYDFSSLGSIQLGLSYLLATLVVLILPHVSDYFLIRTQYLNKTKILGLVYSFLLITIHYYLLGFFGVPFVYFRF